MKEQRIFGLRLFVDFLLPLRANSVVPEGFALLQGVDLFGKGLRVQLLGPPPRAGADALDEGVPKARAAAMMVRAMDPELLAMDEITDEADARALTGALGCGVRLIATAHGASLEDVSARPALRALLEQGAFSRLVTVTNTEGVRRYAVRALS